MSTAVSWPDGQQCEATTARRRQCAREAMHLVPTNDDDPPSLFLCKQHWEAYMTRQGFKLS